MATAGTRKAAREPRTVMVKMYEVTVDGKTQRLTEEQYRAQRARAIKIIRTNLDLIESEATFNRREHQTWYKEVHGTHWYSVGAISDVAGGAVPPPDSIWTRGDPAIRSGRRALESGRLDIAAKQLKLASETLRDVKHEWNEYLGQSIAGAKAVQEDLETTRNVSFAIAVSAAAVVAAPVVIAGAGAALGAGGLGLTGAALSGGTFVASATTITVGGAGLGAALRGGSNVVGQAATGDRVNLGEAWKETKEGAKRGAVDAGSTFVGGQAGKALGLGGKGLSFAQRALRTGVSGGAGGAFGGGLGSTLEGKGAADIAKDTATGFASGFGGGALSGGTSHFIPNAGVLTRAATESATGFVGGVGGAYITGERDRDKLLSAGKQSAIQSALLGAATHEGPTRGGGEKEQQQQRQQQEQHQQQQQQQQEQQQQEHQQRQEGQEQEQQQGQFEQLQRDQGHQQTDPTHKDGDQQQLGKQEQSAVQQEQSTVQQSSDVSEPSQQQAPPEQRALTEQGAEQAAAPQSETQESAANAEVAKADLPNKTPETTVSEGQSSATAEKAANANAAATSESVKKGDISSPVQDEQQLAKTIAKEEAAVAPGTPEASEPTPGLPEPAPRLSPEELQQRVQDTQRQLNAERARVSKLKAATLAKPNGAKEWNQRTRAGAVKRIFNLKERLQVLELIRSHPDKTFYEQVELLGIEGPNGFEPARKRPPKNEFDKYRVADYAAVEGEQLSLGDLKTESAILDSIAGGLSKNLRKPTLTKADIAGKFSKKSTIARQISKETRLINKAQKVGGKVVMLLNDPITGKATRVAVDPSKITSSRISSYGGTPWQ